MTNEDYIQDEKVFCLECKELVVPTVESYLWGADYDGNRGELRYDFTCPKCGGDDLTEDYHNCQNCCEPMEDGADYCEDCVAEMRMLFLKWKSTLVKLGYEEDLIRDVIQEYLEE